MREIDPKHFLRKLTNRYNEVEEKLAMDHEDEDEEPVSKERFDRLAQEVFMEDKLLGMYPVWYTERVRRHMMEMERNDPYGGEEEGDLHRFDLMGGVPEYSLETIQELEKFLKKNELFTLEALLPKYDFSQWDLVRQETDVITDPFNIKAKQHERFTPKDIEIIKQVEEEYREVREELFDDEPENEGDDPVDHYGKQIVELVESMMPERDVDDLAQEAEEKYQAKLKGIQEDLRPVERFKHDVIFYLSNRVFDHKERMLDKIEMTTVEQNFGMTERIQRVKQNRKNKIISTFYDNDALQEFNTLRRMRELAHKSKQFGLDDIHRNLAQKGRDRHLEKTSPRLLQDQVFLGSYRVAHPDDEQDRPPNMIDSYSKSILNPKSQKMRKLDEDHYKEHEVDQPVSDDNALEEFQDKYDFRAKKASPADMDDLDHLKTLAFGEIYDAKPAEEMPDLNVVEHATMWFREKFLFRLSDEQLSQLERKELEIIAYLFYMNKQRKISLGDVFLELSRRRLGLDPTKFKGVGMNRIQRFRTKLTEHFAKRDYLMDMGEIDSVYSDMFPSDKITDFELMDNKDYFELINDLTRERQRGRGGDIFLSGLNVRERGEGDMDLEEIDDESEEATGGINALLDVGPEHKVDYENMPPICLEMELFNLVDLYFSMFGKQDLEKKRLNGGADQIPKDPVLRVDQSLAYEFDAAEDYNIKDGPENQAPYLLPVSQIFKSKPLSDKVKSMSIEVTTEADIDSVVDDLVEEIVKVCPHVYPADFGSDPGRLNPEWSIQNQILRRFGDHVDEQSPVQVWKKAVDWEFTEEDRGIPDEEEIRDPVTRPSHLKKADYENAKETLEKRRLQDLINEMQTDPFFESKLKEYFSSCHQMEVQNQYQQHYQHLEKPEEILDRKTSNVVKNELMDFLVRYSDIRMQTRDQFYSSYAGREVREMQMAQQEKELLFNSVDQEKYLDKPRESVDSSVAESFQKIKDYEMRFFESTKHKQLAFASPLKREVTPAPVKDIVDMEVRLNRLRDKDIFSGMHEIYQNLNEHSTTIPFSLPALDIRQDPEDWVFQKIRGFIREVMSLRLSLERFMTKAELIKFDSELSRLLTRRNLQDVLFGQLDQEVTPANVLRKRYVKEVDVQQQMNFEAGQFEDLQKSFEKKVRNPDAMKRLYAYDSMMSKRIENQKPSEKMSNQEVEEHSYTMEMLMEEAMGADYNYLLWQNEKHDYLNADTDKYMEKEGCRAGRFINNEFNARYFGKTYFEECNAFDVYPDMGSSGAGLKGIRPRLNVPKEFENYSQRNTNAPVNKGDVIFSTIKALGPSDHEHTVSKSLGWYFQKMNEEIGRRV